jgi:hypothetical protein
MKQFYSFSKTLLLVVALASFGTAEAQNETTPASGICTNVTQNFNNGTGGFTSPSVFGNITFDSAFYYNNARGMWTELGSNLNRGASLPGPAPRVVNIISPPYENPNPAGIFDVGFFYIVPNAQVDRFNISLVRITVMPDPSGGGDITFQEVVARSGFKTFASFSAHPPVRYIDPLGGNYAITHSGDSSVVCMRLIDSDITAGPNVSYRVEVTYQILTAGSYSDFDEFAIGNIQAAPLPVNFLGVLAARKDNGVQVRWDVAEEVNVAEYQLQRSSNGRTFTTVGTVPAGGKNLYSYLDGGNKPGMLYYRVKSVDIDGRAKYSGIVRLNGANSFGSGIRVYPSPATSDITVQHSELGRTASITISGADGRILKTVRPVPGTSNSMVNISGLSSGLYILRLDDGKGKVESASFIKQ